MLSSQTSPGACTRVRRPPQPRTIPSTRTQRNTTLPESYAIDRPRVIPIVAEESGMPIGIVTDRDIVIRTIADGLDPVVLTARDCMTAPAITVSEDEHLSDVIDLLERRQLRRVIVVDRNGAVSGIISQADIATHASKRKAGELLQEVSHPVGVQGFTG
jgi:predicted transcriptional regulator